MPVHRNVTDREYREAKTRLSGIISAAIRHDLAGSHPERPALLNRIAGEIANTIATREIRKEDQSKLAGYAEGIVSAMEATHTERRCWHVTSRTWRPAAEGRAYKLGRMAAEAGKYDADLTVTFWKPEAESSSLCVYSGSVAEGYGTRFSEWGSIDEIRPPDQSPACDAPFFVDGICRMCGVSISAHPTVTIEPEQAATGAANVTLPGRHGAGQVDALFTKSGLVERPVLMHNPILAFFPAPNGGIAVQVVKSAAEAAGLPPATPLLWQWPGKIRSDWFNFTAADLRDHLARVRGEDA